MKYIKTEWEDRDVDFPNRYKDQNNKVYDFIKDPGTIRNAGTKISKKPLNNIENGIESLYGMLKDDGDGTKFLSDDGTYKEGSGGSVPEGVVVSSDKSIKDIITVTPEELQTLVDNNALVEGQEINVLDGMSEEKQTYAILSASSGQSINGGSETPIAFDSVKGLSNITKSADSKKFTIVEDGLYQVDVALSKTAGSQCRFFMNLNLTNQGSLAYSYYRSSDTQMNNGDPSINLAATVYLKAGAQLSVECWCSIAGTIRTTSSTSETSLSIIKIGQYPKGVN